MRTDLAEFRRLRAEGRLTAEATERLSGRAASDFMAHYHRTGGYLREAITLLCEIATLDDHSLARPGLRGIFSFLVERLSDSFDPDYCPLYDRIFAQVVDFCRRLPAGKALDAELRRFGLLTEGHLLERKARTKLRRSIHAGHPVRKALVLSRVTLGAEVAVTSVVLAKMKRAFPQAELLLLAAPQMGQLFSGIRVRGVRYERDGGLIERLNSWLAVLEAIDDEIKGLRPEEYLIVDPDSRLTQLGIFPLVEDEAPYCFFESRGYRKPGIEGISQLTVSWLNELTGQEPAQDDKLYPYLSLRQEDQALGQALAQRLRTGGGAYLVGVNFGVGGNERKRVGDPFEESLLSSLIDDGGTVILAKGVGREEIERADRLIEALRERGKAVVEFDEGAGHLPETIQADVLAWQGGVGLFCALIAASDEYIGYDSAGQHLAAALGVPTIDIFADHSYPLISERWRPHGPGIVRVVKAEAGDDLDRILDKVMACHREIRDLES